MVSAPKVYIICSNDDSIRTACMGAILLQERREKWCVLFSIVYSRDLFSRALAIRLIQKCL